MYMTGMVFFGAVILALCEFQKYLDYDEEAIFLTKNAIGILSA